MNKYYATIFSKSDGKSKFFNAIFEFRDNKITKQEIEEKLKDLKEDLLLDEISLINLILLDD